MFTVARQFCHYTLNLFTLFSSLALIATEVYEGCFSGSNNSEVIGNYGINTCRQNCLAFNKAYARLKGGECACTDVNGTARVDDAQCTMECASGEGQLCGGDPDLWTVYTTFREYGLIALWLPGYSLLFYLVLCAT